MPPTVYERAGGRPFFVALVEHFYARVEKDALLRPMYPADLTGARERLTLFLVQYFGGPREYAAARGEPRLRLRHLEFAIDASAREAWLAHMRAALESLAPAPEVSSELLEYFSQTSAFLINRGGLSISGSS